MEEKHIFQQILINTHFLFTLAARVHAGHEDNSNRYVNSLRSYEEIFEAGQRHTYLCTEILKNTNASLT